MEMHMHVHMHMHMYMYMYMHVQMHMYILGTFWDRFGIIVGSEQLAPTKCSFGWISVGSVRDHFGMILRSSSTSP